MRYIAAARSNPPEPPVDEDTHFVVFVHEGESAETVEERARETCDTNGWAFLSVGPESDERNIPRMQPKRWAEMQRRLNEMNRRARIHGGC